MVKYYQIFGAGDYIFNGYSDVIIKVIKETKDKIYGIETNMRGNENLYTMKAFNQEIRLGEKIVIIKRNVQGWKELK